MKSLFSIAMLAIIIASCQKNNGAPASNQPASSTPSLIRSDMTSTTVTTESALKAAVAAAKAGDIITISGTINLTSTLQLLNSGTSSSKINISGGTLNCAGVGSGNWGVKVNGSYWNVQNIHITKAPAAGIVFQLGGNNYVNNLTTDYNGDTGLEVYNGAYNVSINNCHSTQNYDPSTGGENADGIDVKLSSGAGNTITGCTSTYNSDDGYDLYGNPYPVVITNCVANNNGKDVNGDGNGFKLGSSGQNMHHKITNSSASNNSPGWGFTRNGNAKGAVTYSGLTGSGNAAGLIDL